MREPPGEIENKGSRFLALLALEVSGLVGASMALFYWLWVILEPLTLTEAHGAPLPFALWLGLAAVSLAALVPVWRRATPALRWGSVTTIVALLVIPAALIWPAFRWRLRLSGVPSMHEMPLDPEGYEIERLPFAFAASFARGHEVYFAGGDGAVFKADDRDPEGTREKIGASGVRPRMIFVSSRGVLFVSGQPGAEPLRTSSDGGGVWSRCLEHPVWRMDEHDASGTLYAGTYAENGAALIYKSVDDGASWLSIFADERLDHVHTLRCDQQSGRLLAAVGDGPHRGQLYSDDAGATWNWIVAGIKQGHTDVAVGARHVFWASDDGLGRVLRVPRGAIVPESTELWSAGQQAWFAVARERQVYVGTYTDAAQPEPAYLVASRDDGHSWQKLMEVQEAGGAEKALNASSRRLSADGWIFISTSAGTCYRVRSRPLSR